MGKQDWVSGCSNYQRGKRTLQRSHKVGDQIELSGHNTGNMCGFFYHDLFPYVIMLQFGGGFPPEWGNPDVLEMSHGQNE